MISSSAWQNPRRTMGVWFGKSKKNQSRLEQPAPVLYMTLQGPVKRVVAYLRPCQIHVGKVKNILQTSQLPGKTMKIVHIVFFNLHAFSESSSSQHYLYKETKNRVQSHPLFWNTACFPAGLLESRDFASGKFWPFILNTALHVSLKCAGMKGRRAYSSCIAAVNNLICWQSTLVMFTLWTLHNAE